MRAMEDQIKTVTVRTDEVFNATYVIGDQHCEMPESFTLEAGAKATVTVVILPDVSVDLPVKIDLLGEHSQFEISGVYVCCGEEKVKLALELKHHVPMCNSRQLFKGIVGGKANVDFYGKIIVAQDAVKTEAYQENHNILMSDDAKVNTKPQLEIYADDVKCTHGATIGRLNEEEQFYMRSRGISLDEAKVLQMISFLHPTLDNVSEAEKEILEEKIDEAVRRMAIR